MVRGWIPNLGRDTWKLNTNASRCPSFQVGGLRWVICDHLGRVCWGGMKTIDHRYEIKFFKSLTVFEGLSPAIETINVKVFAETNCLDVVNLLNNQSINFTEVTFVVDEIKTFGFKLQEGLLHSLN